MPDPVNFILKETFAMALTVNSGRIKRVSELSKETTYASWYGPTSKRSARSKQSQLMTSNSLTRYPRIVLNRPQCGIRGQICCDTSTQSRAIAICTVDQHRRKTGLHPRQSARIRFLHLHSHHR